MNKNNVIELVKFFFMLEIFLFDNMVQIIAYKVKDRYLYIFWF